jgi:alanyl-tRNA synthetase
MLGNFSFGDYFKKEAIEFAWEFLTRDLNLKEEDLWVSVYKDDEESYEIWKNSIGVPVNKIVKLDEEKNFWPSNAPLLGPNGPCGPCSEIFFDKGKEKGCQRKNCDPSCECGRFVEIWNLVFTQFNRVDKNKLEPLPQKNIDTGMGLERMASVLQGKESNFEIDILYPVVEFIKEMLKKEDLELIYAIVDHIRAATFAIGDGVFPSNEERGYVIRKLIRSAVWKANILGKREPFLYRLVDLYAELMKHPYPEIDKNKSDISKVIKEEEKRFLSTLEEGKKQIVEIIKECKEDKKSEISAQKLFRLYDTFGFPPELSKEIANNYGIEVDMKGFKELLDKQKELSRKKSMFEESIFSLKDKIVLEDKTEFVGYDNFEAEGKILRLIKDNKEVEEIKEGDKAIIVLDKTPFYPESGGQLSDKGWIETKRGKFFVEEVFKVEESILHKGKVIKGKITKEEVKGSIDQERRQALERSHTATHLLQAALRKILGTHLRQQGSLVDGDRLRFDFAHFKGLTEEELEATEKLVNEFILRADKVEKKITTLEEAKKEGALAFFKEKYQDRVRLVSVSSYSKELCAGTHLDNTSEVGLFLIISESSISSGIRRIEAIVGKKAYQYLKNLNKDYKSVCNFLKIKPFSLKENIEKLNEELKREKQKVIELEKRLISLKVEEIFQNKKEIDNKNYLIYELKENQRESLLWLWDSLKTKTNSLFVFLVSFPYFICATTEDLIKEKKSSKEFLFLYKDKLSIKGGGKDTLVQGVVSKKDVDFFKNLEECIRKFLQKK